MPVVWPSKNNFANGGVLTAANMNNIGDTLNVFNPTSATNGQVWIANGSGSGAYGTATSPVWSSITSSTSTASTINLSVTGDNFRQLGLFINSSHSSVTLPTFNVNGTTTASIYPYTGLGPDGAFYNRQNQTPFVFGGASATQWFVSVQFYRFAASGARWGVVWQSSNGTSGNGFFSIINTGTAVTSIQIVTANVTSATYTLLGVAN